jgi:beta-aspartyl-dipeptidase (metallo-type)
LEKYAVADPQATWITIKRLVKEKGWTLPEAIPLATSHVAEVYQLKKKGYVRVGYDADLIVVSVDLQIEHVLANGIWMKRGDTIKKGMFE